MKIRCAIVDDNIDDLNKITELINNLSYESNTSFEVESFSDPRKLQLIKPYDLFILDIDMPEINGFVLANKIYEKNQDSVIIFCSAHDDLVFDSFKLNAFYFVRKSFLKEDMILALKKFISRCFSLNAEYICKTSDSIIRIPLKDVIYFEVSRNDLYIHTKDKEYQDRKSLKQLKSDLGVNYFIQISQNFMVNAYYIDEISNNKVVVSGGISFDIPRRNIREVKNCFVQFLSR